MSDPGTILIDPPTGAGTRIRDTRRTEPVQSGANRFNMPLRFEENRGQAHSRVRFFSRGDDCRIALTDEGVEWGVDGASSKGNGSATASTLRMSLAGGANFKKIEGRKRLMGGVSYFSGRDRKQWLTGIRTYGEVVYRDVYPGIDLVYYGASDRLEYDFEVAPGADPSRIIMRFHGADRIEIDGQGDLLLHAGDATLRHHRPIVYQKIHGMRQPLPGEYMRIGKHDIAFRIGVHDRTHPLVIDPVLVYSTFIGGSSHDEASEIAVDSRGSAYVVGTTHSLDFPVDGNAPRKPGQYGANMDAFVLKLSPDGKEIVYCAYLGGGGNDEGRAVAVDDDGNAYVVGYTESLYDPGSPDLGLEGRDGFPTTAGAFDPTGHSSDAFLSKIDPEGRTLLYSSFLGYGNKDEANAVAVDHDGNAYIAGMTLSTYSDTFPELFQNFPTTPGAYQREFGGAGLLEGDAFVAKFDTHAAGAASLIYSTYVGGNGGDTATAIALDADGSVIITGRTGSDNWPISANGVQRDFAGGGLVLFGDGFVTKLNPSGTGITFSTYLGGGEADQLEDVAIDRDGNILVTGYTYSSILDRDYPVTEGAFQDGKSVDRCANPYEVVDGSGHVVGIIDKGKLCSDIVVSKLTPDGSSLIYSTYMGGNFVDSGEAIVTDAEGNAYISGRAGSTNFIVSRDSPLFIPGAGKDGFLAKLDPSGKVLFISQSAARSEGMAIDGVGDLYLTGFADWRYPVTPGAPQSRSSGGIDAFVTRVSRLDLPTTPPSQLFKLETAGGSIVTEEGAKVFLMIHAEPGQPDQHSITPSVAVIGPDNKVLASESYTLFAGTGNRELLPLGVPSVTGDYVTRFLFPDASLEWTFKVPSPVPSMSPPGIWYRAADDGSLLARWRTVEGAAGYFVWVYAIQDGAGETNRSLIGLGASRGNEASLPAGWLRAGERYIVEVAALSFDPYRSPYPSSFYGALGHSETFAVGTSSAGDPPDFIPPDSTPSNPVAGDLNGDRNITVVDATLALRIAVGLLSPSDAQRAAGDINGDGRITVADVTRILRIAVGLDEPSG